MSLASGGFEARIKFSHLACCLKFRDSGSPNSACTLRSSLLRLFSFFPYCLQLKEASGQFQHSAWKSISLNLQVHYETFYILCVCRQWICQLLCYHKYRSPCFPLYIVFLTVQSATTVSVAFAAFAHFPV